MARKTVEPKVKHYIVEGSGAFPIDMLRYDCCWPSDLQSVESVSMNLEWGEPYFKTRRVQISSTEYPTPDRWRSFCWPIVHMSWEPLKAK
jgi:hypothetical protein